MNIIRKQRFAGLLGGALGLLAPLGTLALMPETAAAQSINLTFTTYPIPTANSAPEGITRGPDLALWFTETAANKIGRIDISGAVKEFSLAALHGNGGLQNIATGPTTIGSVLEAAPLWFTARGAIGQITTTGTLTSFVLPGGASNDLYSIAAGPDGNMWFTDRTTVAVGRITPTGQITEFKLPNAPGAVSPGIGAITAGPDGALWFIDFLNASIGRITMSGVIAEYPAPNLAGADPHAGIIDGQDGAIWFGEGGERVGRMTASGSLMEYPAELAPAGLATGPDGNTWFIDGSGLHIAHAIPGLLGVMGYSSPAAGAGMVEGIDGALWYTSPTTNEIVRVEVPTRVAVLPQLVAGGGWGTAITLTNISGNSVSARVSFYNGDGNSLLLPVTVTQGGNSTSSALGFLDLTIGPQSIVYIETANQASMVTGWVDITATGALGGYAVIRRTEPAGAPSEASVLLQNSSFTLSPIPFDNTNGRISAVALANLAADVPATVTATIWDDTGMHGTTRTVTLAGNGHAAFALADMFPSTAGERGMVEFGTTGGGLIPPLFFGNTGGVSSLLLEFYPDGSFTSIPQASSLGNFYFLAGSFTASSAR